MTTALVERQEGREHHLSPDQIDEVVGATVRITADPLLGAEDRVRELADRADHDQELLGRAWVKVAIESMRHPSAIAIAAEQLLRDALELDVEPAAH